MRKFWHTPSSRVGIELVSYIWLIIPRPVLHIFKYVVGVQDAFADAYGSSEKTEQ